MTQTLYIQGYRYGFVFSEPLSAGRHDIHFIVSILNPLNPEDLIMLNTQLIICS